MKETYPSKFEKSCPRRAEDIDQHDVCRQNSAIGHWSSKTRSEGNGKIHQPYHKATSTPTLSTRSPYSEQSLYRRKYCQWHFPGNPFGPGSTGWKAVSIKK